jgi:hypothetical protein
MTQRTVRTEHDRAQLLTLLKDRKLPFVLSVAKGAKRTDEQNRLQHQWYREAQDQSDMTAEEWRGECKLRVGVPIRRAEDEAFRRMYDEMVKPLPYEHKLKLMMEPFDLAVTRDMSVEQKTRYLDGVQRFLAERGIALTLPEEA